MSSEPAPTAPPRPFGRILLGLDPTSDDPAIPRQAADLAARLNADIRTLFVEDEEALALTENPAVRIVSTVTATTYHVDRILLERSRRGRVAASRQSIASVMAARSIATIFDVRRGVVVDELIAAADDADLIVLGWGSRGLGRRHASQPSRPGSVACAVAERSDVPVLLLLPLSPVNGPTVIAFDGTPSAARAFDAAMALSTDHDRVIVALITDRTAEVQRWREELSSRCSNSLHFQHVPLGDPATLLAATRQAGAAMLVLGMDGADCCGGPLRRVLDGAGCSILLVR
jgi:nucleotide-binding universal stress UspA family protein